MQEHLEQLVRDNEQLKAEVKELLNSSALMTSPRDQGKLSVTDMFALSASFFLWEISCNLKIIISKVIIV